MNGCATKSAVAMSTSHGTSAAKREGGVRSRSHAPTPPPSRLGAAKPIAHWRGDSESDECGEGEQGTPASDRIHHAGDGGDQDDGRELQHLRERHAEED